MKKQNEKVHKSVNLAYEAGSLRYIKRLWAQTLGPGVANDLEHTYRVMLLALMISRMEKKGDEGKVMKMALLHDLCEARSTDVAFLNREYVVRHEEKAMHDQLTGTFFEADLVLLAEFEKKESIESKIVKDADDLEVDLELRELASQGSRPAQNLISKNRGNVGEKLYTKSAKEIWQAIYKIEPDNWQSEITSAWALKRKNVKK